MTLSSSTDSASTSCASSNEALLQIVFNASVSSTVRQEGGMRVSVTVPSNGTTVDSFTFRQGDILHNLTACLSKSGCYALELINVWKGYYQIFYDGSLVTDSIQFPYYVTAPSSPGGSNSSSSHLIGGSTNGTDVSTSMSMMTATNDDNPQQQQQGSFEPYESNLTFVELVTQQQGSSSSSQCVPECDLATESLVEVQIYAGSYGDGALSWRIQDEGGGGADQLMGCEDDGGASTGRCGTVNGVRLQRACLPKSGRGCRRFVMGHPNLVPSEGSEMYDDDQQQQESSSQAEPASVDLWVGHYPPSFTVLVDGTVAAEGTSATFASADVVSNGNGSSACTDECASDESLLEIFQYRTGAPLQYSLRDLHTLDVVLRSSNSSNTVLVYERQCVPAFRCYDLTFTSNEEGGAAATASASSHNASLDSVSDGVGGVSTQVVLGGTYYANTMVHDLPFRVILGERCERQEACSSDELLVQVDINTSGEAENASQHVPGYYCAWSVLDERDLPTSRLPQESMTYFSNGYSGGSMFRHYACVPDVSSMSFAMLGSVPSDVAWSLERNGVVLDCREHRTNHSAPFKYLDDYILTPLDGSCRHSPTIANRDSSSSTTSASMSTDLIVGIAIGILAAVAFLGVAVFYSGGEEERSRRRSGSNNNSGGAGGAAAAASSNRSVGTACESDLAWSDDEDDEGDCVP
jgi:hypothetical protein